MRLSGDFILRQVMDEILAIPVGESAARMSGMLILNPVSRLIWERLGENTDLPALVSAVTGAFDVSSEQAEADITEFLEKLRSLNLLSE